MKRPVLVAVIGYIIGILWGLYLKFSIVPLLFILIILCIIKKKYSKLIIILTITILISNIQVNYLNNKYENLYSDEEEYIIIGTIVSEPQEKEYKNVYKIKVESINGNSKYKNTQLLLNVKKKDKNNQLKYGDKVKLNAIYTKPETSRNYKGFNYREYLKTIKIYGNITLNSQVQLIKHNNINIIFRIINNIKQKIISNINKMLPEKTANMSIGILLGDTDNLDNDLKEQFKISSLYHILAVSGTHVSYLILGIAFILEKTKINKRKSKIISIIILIFFMILTGLTPSVVRAGIMGIILIGARNIS